MKRTLLLVVACVLSLTTVFAQNKAVSGKVIAAADGLPLPGVSVSVKGTPSVGTQTDAAGTFKLSVPANATTLVFKYIGYKYAEAAITGTTVNVKLTEDSKQLSEVVVVGYGTQIKQDLTGSIARVSSKDFENQPLSTFESALQGRAAGVYINSGSGKLGQGMSIRIRGISSVSAGNDPLYVIDGQPVLSQSIGSATEPDNPLASIAPEDIESIDVLKDASAAAIYGSRATNGVVLITTKSGKQGKTKVNFSYNTGTSTPTRKREWLNAAEYRELFTAAAENSSYASDWAGNPESIAETAWMWEAGGSLDDWRGTTDQNWANEAFQTGGVSNYNVSVNGGDAKTSFFISGGYNDQKGIILMNSLNRTNGRLNLTHQVSDRFKLGANISLNKTVNNRVSSDNAFTNPLQLNALPPIQPKYDATTGKYNANTLYYNVLIEQGAATAASTQLRSLSTFTAQYNLSKSLTLNGEFGMDVTQLEEENYNGRETLDGAPTGVGFNRQVIANNNNSNVYLNYTKTFGKHNLQVTGGMSYQESQLKTASSTGQGFPNDKYTKIASAAIISGGSSTETGYSFLSYFTRANYKFNNKYLFGASVRVDGSSRFGDSNRYGTFPAFSAGWILSEENFLKKWDKISFLKLRGSFGTTGNSEIGNFSSLTLYSSSPYADQSGIVPSQIGVSDLKWEKTNKLDLGLDFGLFNNRVSGEIDYFSSKTRDLLLSFPLPASNGFTSIVRNVGALENKGFEFVLNTNNLVGAFKWTSSLNISTYRNKIVDMGGSVISGGSRQLGRIAEGEAYGYFYGYKYAGVNPANGNAQYVNADGSVVDQDNFDYSEQKLGNPNPDFYGGFNNKFSYKGFDLDIQSQFVYGNDLYNIAGFFQSVNGDYYDNQSRDQMNYWKTPGQITNIPQPRLYDGNGALKSSRWVQDGSYFRIKNVVLGYTIPKSFLAKYKIDNARIYMAAQNLFTITKYEGYDPEVNATYTGGVNLGHDFYTPPQAKTISFGVNIGF